MGHSLSYNVTLEPSRYVLRSPFGWLPLKLKCLAFDDLTHVSPHKLQWIFQDNISLVKPFKLCYETIFKYKWTMNTHNANKYKDTCVIYLVYNLFILPPYTGKIRKEMYWNKSLRKEEKDIWSCPHLICLFFTIFL